MARLKRVIQFEGSPELWVERDFCVDLTRAPPERPLLADTVEKAVKYSLWGGSSQCFRRMVGRVVSAAPWAALRALCRPHLRKHIDRFQAGEPPEVLGGRRKEEFVLSSVWSSQTQTRQTKDSLEVSE
jgi:hypothetical protein